MTADNVDLRPAEWAVIEGGVVVSTHKRRWTAARAARRHAPRANPYNSVTVTGLGANGHQIPETALVIQHGFDRIY